ncbi:MAG: DUF2752 domain-containing protein [Deltaproteobacteria bacterium]|nr:DUF2752 domain-containing protein [Candidatus Zymogenaceae bacterium]
MWQILLVPAAVVLFCAMVLFFDPVTSIIYPPCPFRVLTGWYCPGCGALWAVHELLSGRIISAISSNALAVIAVPILLGAYLERVYWFVTKKRLRKKPLQPIWIWAILAVIIIFAVVRNIQTYPCAFLAP